MPAQGLINMSVFLGMDITGFETKLRKSQSELQKFGRLMNSVGSKLTLGITAPLAAIGFTAVKTGGDFQAAVNRIQAATQATGKSFTDLEAKARTLGETTQFSATEAAAGIEVLAKNGLDVQSILNGAADASLNLAAATGGDLATSADIATDVMNNFNKKAEDLAGIVDQITGVTVKSKFTIDDYRLALGQAGGVAGALGVTLKDFNTAIAATSSAFASGSDAGTSFKTFLQRLNPQSKEAATLMKQLGLEFFDSNGKMKSLGQIAGQLQKAFSQLSDEQRNNAASTIFGNDALRTALLLAKQGEGGFNALAESIDKVSAADQAKTRMSGFNGALKEFYSAVESVKISIANSGILDFMEGLVRGATGLLRSISGLNPEILKWGTIIGAVAAAIGPLMVAIGTLSTTLIPALTAGFALLTGPIGLVIAAVVGLTAAMLSFYAANNQVIDPKKLGFQELQSEAKKSEEEIVKLQNSISRLKATSGATGAYASGGGDSAATKIKQLEDQLEKAIQKHQTYSKELEKRKQEDNQYWIEQADNALALKKEVDVLGGTFTNFGNDAADAFDKAAERAENLRQASAQIAEELDKALNVGGLSKADRQRAGKGENDFLTVSQRDEVGKAAGIKPDFVTSSTGEIGLSQENEDDIFAGFAPEDFEGMDAGKEKADELKEAMKVLAQNANTVKSTFASAFSAASDNTRKFGEVVKNTVAKTIKAFIAEGIAGIVAKSLASAPFPAGAILAAAAGAAAGVLLNKLIPTFADGGIVYGPTVGLMGEYAGASGNPEVIAPLDKLKSILKSSGGTGSGRGELAARVSGTDLLFIVREAEKNEYFNN